MTSQSLPPDLGQFVEQQVASGNYRSADEVIADAVRVLRDLELRQISFRDEIQRGVDQLASGDYQDYDDQGLRDRFEQLKQRAMARGDTGTSHP